MLVLALSLLCLHGCISIVQPGQSAMFYRPRRSPALQKEILQPGRYRTWGRARLITYDVTSQNRDEVVSVLTADNLHVPVTVTVTFHARRNELVKLHTEIGPDYYNKILGPMFITLVRAEFSRHQHNNLARESPVIEKTVKDRLSEIASTHALDVDQVAIRHIDFDDTVTASISRKIATRQQAEQKVYEVQIAERDADIARTAAQGRADATKIQGQGEAAAIIARGTAQAEVQEKIGKTLTTSYLQYKAFDSHAASYFFVPTGKDNLPVIINPPAQH
jgi:regulator of protease activity HflC (stomatin/prohibitin superfamily)